MPGGAHENMKAWAPEEDYIILEMHAQDGPKWSKIVQRLPGRTVSSVRNRWQRIEKGRKLREAGKESKNRCHACGQLKRGHVCTAKMRGGPQVDLVGVAGAAATPVVERSWPMVGDGANPLSAVPSGIVPLRATRSSERLTSRPGHPVVRVESGGGVGHGLSVDIGLGASGLRGGPSSGASGVVPLVARSNTSFFGTLAASDLFSPNSRDLLSNWASSPIADAEGNHFGSSPAMERVGGFLQQTANDPAAPPALRRVASGGEANGPPKITRSLTSYLDDLSKDTGLDAAPLSGGSSSCSMPPPSVPAVSKAEGSSSFSLPDNLYTSDAPAASDPLGLNLGLNEQLGLPASAQPPPLVKRKSSRLTFGELADLAFD